MRNAKIKTYSHFENSASCTQQLTNLIIAKLQGMAGESLRKSPEVSGSLRKSPEGKENATDAFIIFPKQGYELLEC